MLARAVALLRRCPWGSLLILVVGAQLLVHALWLARYADPTLGEVVGWDTRWHLRNCAVYHGAMHDALDSGRGAVAGLAGSLSALRIDHRAHLLNPLWPRLTYLAALPGALLLGSSGRALEGMNALWLGLLLVSVYSIGRRCAGPPAGLLAAFMTSIYPGIFGVARRFELDFHLAAVVALAVLLLLRTDGFRRPLASAVLGLVVGAGVLCEARLVLFLVPLLTTLLAALARPAPARRARILLHFATTVALALAVSAVWWRGSSEYLRFRINTAAGSTGLVGYLHDGLFHLAGAAECCGPLVLLLSLPGLVLALREPRVAHRELLAAWLGGAYLVLTGLDFKLQRFFLPALPAVALLSACGLVTAWRSPAPWRRSLARLLAAGIVLEGTVQLVGVSFASWGIPFVWGWTEGAQRALAGPSFERGVRSNHALWHRPSDEELAAGRELVELADEIRVAAAPGGGRAGRRARIGAVGRTTLTRLELPLALREHEAFSFALLASPPARAGEPPGWITQYGPPADARDLEEAPRTDYAVATGASPVTEELEQAALARLSKEDERCAACSTRWRAQIRYVRRCFVEVAWRRSLPSSLGLPGEALYLLRNTCAASAAPVPR
jgi:hypothetical protein